MERAISIIIGVLLIVLALGWSGWWWLGSQLTMGPTTTYMLLAVAGVIPLVIGVLVLLGKIP